MSKKTRGDSVLDKLPPNQQEALARWLFEENLTYVAARQRLFADFAVRVSQAALCSFYQRAAQSRLLQRIAESAQKANLVMDKFSKNPSDSYRALLNMIGEIAFNKSLEKELDVESLFDLTRLLIAGKRTDIKSEDLALQRDKFQFSAAEACLKQLPALRTIAADNSLDQDAKLQAIRAKLFGELPQ